MQQGRVRALGLGALAAAAALALGACSQGGGPAESPLVVLAAASLERSFRELSGMLEADRPGTRVRISFAGTQTLVTQVRERIPADLIATADPAALDELVASGLVEPPRVFTSNRLVWILAASFAGGRVDAGDGPLEGEFLRGGDVRLVLAAPSVPAGRYAREALASLGLLAPAEAHLVSREMDVRGVLSKVALGEADAGLGYATEVTPDAGGVVVRELPERAQVRVRYAIAILGGARNRAAAGQFADLVLSERGQASLGRAGFGPP